jgi:hypothetical protein
VSDDSKWILGICRHGQWELLVEEFEGDEERCDLEKLVRFNQWDLFGFPSSFL